MNETIKEEIVEWIKIIITALFFCIYYNSFYKTNISKWRINVPNT